MAESIVSFFEGIGLSGNMAVFLVSMLPIVELRGAIPLGILMGMNKPELLALTVLGNILPVPLIILCARPIVNFCLRTKFLRPVGSWMENKVKKNSGKILKYEVWGLFVFVAIPLPGTGAWTGALLAALMDLRLKNAFPAITLGVITAGFIMLFGSTFVEFLVNLF